MPDICDICGGRRIIVLPVMPRLSLSVQDASFEPYATTITKREFPCPQCAPTTHEDRIDVATVGSEQTVRGPGLMHDRVFRDAMEREVAHGIAHFLLDHGYINFQWREPVSISDAECFPPPELSVRGTVGVVAPAVVASMEQRIAERQEEFAAEVVEEAIRQIDHWGSYYGHTGLSKAQAADSVRTAVKGVRNRRAAKPLVA